MVKRPDPEPRDPLRDVLQTANELLQVSKLVLQRAKATKVIGVYVIDKFALDQLTVAAHKLATCGEILEASHLEAKEPPPEGEEPGG